MRGLSPVAASGDHSSSRCAGLSLSRPLPLRGTGSRRAGSVIVAHGPSCSAACGIFPDQGSNPCPLHWQADSQPLRHQGSPQGYFLLSFLSCKSLNEVSLAFRQVLSSIMITLTFVEFFRDFKLFPCMCDQFRESADFCILALLISTHTCI